VDSGEWITAFFLCNPGGRTSDTAGRTVTSDCNLSSYYLKGSSSLSSKCCCHHNPQQVGILVPVTTHEHKENSSAVVLECYIVDIKSFICMY
jgi:hypothetical protein